MKSLLFILFVTFSLSSNAQDKIIYQFNNVSFMTTVPGAGEGKVKRLATLISDYVSSIETDSYSVWYSKFSDSTIARVAPHKFPNKFKRMKEYGMHGDTIRVLSVVQLSSPYENEVGTEYEIVVDFGIDLNVANRVSFDHLKGGENTNNQAIGFNVITTDKGYVICIHKYITSNANGEGGGN